MIKYFSDAVKKNISKQFLLWSLRADFSNLGIFWTTEENIITFMNSATGSNHRGNSHSGGRQSKQRAHLYWCAIKRNKVHEQSNLHWGEILGNTPRGYTDTVTKDKGNMAVFIHTNTLKGIGNTWITSHRWKQSKQQHTMKPQGHRYRQKGGRGLSGICMTDVNFCANTCKILWAVIKVASFDFEGNGRRSWFALIFYSFATFLFADVW